MKAEDYLHKKCSFMAPDGRQLVGIVVECVETTPFGLGKIPDFTVTIRGSSGRTMTVSATEAYLQLSD